jgi:hypothetical protein
VNEVFSRSFLIGRPISPRHNLDVMNIKKNMFENIFNAVIDMKGKTNKNIKARLNIFLFCHYKKIKLVYDRSWVAKPKASFNLDKNAQLRVYQWLKSPCFPNGHALNISRLVNLEDCRLYGIKSHDCHVLIYTNTHSTNLPRFNVKGDMRCTHGDQSLL